MSAVRAVSRPHVLHVGRSATRPALHAARLDGCRCLVPVPGRCVRGRMARHRARLARLRQAEWNREATGSTITSPTSTRSSIASRPRAGAPRRSQPRRQRGQSVRGLRPARVSHVVSLDSFGMPARSGRGRAREDRKWLDALRDPPGFTLMQTWGRRRPVAEEQSRLSRDKAEFLARHWAARCRMERPLLASDPRHKLPFPTVYRHGGDVCRLAQVTAPVLWVAARDSVIVQRWLEQERGPQSIRRDARMPVLPDARFVMIEDAGSYAPSRPARGRRGRDRAVPLVVNRP